MTRVIAPLLLCFGLQVNAPAASAHDFWIEVQPNGRAAHLRVGEMLVGEALPYLDRTVRTARQHGPGGGTMLEGRQGDLPALSVDLAQPGLHAIVVETMPAYTVFDTLAEFSAYLADEGLGHIVDAHRQRGLPQVEIAEEYVRHARALVQVGEPGPQDIDTASGLLFELVALQSPFVDEASAVDLQLLWEGAPVAGAQVSVMHAPSGETGNVSRTLLLTDDDGKVTADIRAGGAYLFNAVHMIPADGPGSVIWQSHWASLSFTRAPVGVR